MLYWGMRGWWKRIWVLSKILLQGPVATTSKNYQNASTANRQYPGEWGVLVDYKLKAASKGITSRDRDRFIPLYSAFVRPHLKYICFWSPQCRTYVYRNLSLRSNITSSFSVKGKMLLEKSTESRHTLQVPNLPVSQVSRTVDWDAVMCRYVPARKESYLLLPEMLLINSGLLLWVTCLLSSISVMVFTVFWYTQAVVKRMPD